MNEHFKFIKKYYQHSVVYREKNIIIYFITYSINNDNLFKLLWRNCRNGKKKLGGSIFTSITSTLLRLYNFIATAPFSFLNYYL